MTVLRSDTVQRANVASGWGTATDGNAWTIQGGDGQSVASDELVITNSSTSTFATLGPAITPADAEGLVRYANGPNTGGPNGGILLRWQDSSNHWLARTNSGNTLEILVKVAGTYTVLSPTYSMFFQDSTFYWFRFRLQGANAFLRVWQDGTSEPTAWQIQASDPSGGSAAGMVGLYGYAPTSNYLDHFQVTDLSPAPTPSSPVYHFPHSRFGRTFP